MLSTQTLLSNSFIIMIFGSHIICTWVRLDDVWFRCSWLRYHAALHRPFHFIRVLHTSHYIHGGKWNKFVLIDVSAPSALRIRAAVTPFPAEVSLPGPSWESSHRSWPPSGHSLLHLLPHPVKEHLDPGGNNSMGSISKQLWLVVSIKWGKCL